MYKNFLNKLEVIFDFFFNPFLAERCGGCARSLHQILGALSILLRLLEKIRRLREEEGQPRKCPNGESDRILCSLGYLSLYIIIINAI